MKTKVKTELMEVESPFVEDSSSPYVGLKVSCPVLSPLLHLFPDLPPTSCIPGPLGKMPSSCQEALGLSPDSSDAQSPPVLVED